jgi:hypothetical protein
VLAPGQWPRNLGSDRDWQFVAQPNPHLNRRSIPQQPNLTVLVHAQVSRLILSGTP